MGGKGATLIASFSGRGELESGALSPRFGKTAGRRGTPGGWLTKSSRRDDRVHARGSVSLPECRDGETGQWAHERAADDGFFRSNR